MQLISDAFSNTDTIPVRFTGRGGNFSPPLAWTDVPPGTKSFAVFCLDPDAPHGTFVHWVLFDLPADCRQLKAGIPPKPALLDGGVQGKNDFGEIGYGGPDPPPGNVHHYRFKLYALDTALDLPAGIRHDQLHAAMVGHVLAEAECWGTYST